MDTAANDAVRMIVNGKREDAVAPATIGSTATLASSTRLHNLSGNA